MLEFGHGLIGMAEAAVTLPVAAAACGDMVDPGRRLVRVVVAARAGVATVAIDALLAKHFHMIGVVKGDHGTLFI